MYLKELKRKKKLYLLYAYILSKLKNKRQCPKFQMRAQYLTNLTCLKLLVRVNFVLTDQHKFF